MAEMLTTVLVPLDGSALAEYALPYAARLARAAGGRLVLVRAAPDAPARQRAEAELAAVAERLFTEGVPVEAHVRRGAAGDVILEGARAWAAGLIVTATHGRSGVGRWLHGSVADHVLRHAPVPVLLVSRACERRWPEGAAGGAGSRGRGRRRTVWAPCWCPWTAPPGVGGRCGRRASWPARWGRVCSWCRWHRTPGTPRARRPRAVLRHRRPGSGGGAGRGRGVSRSGGGPLAARRARRGDARRRRPGGPHHRPARPGAGRGGDRHGHPRAGRRRPGWCWAAWPPACCSWPVAPCSWCGRRRRPRRRRPLSAADGPRWRARRRPVGPVGLPAAPCAHRRGHRQRGSGRGRRTAARGRTRWRAAPARRPTCP